MTTYVLSFVGSGPDDGAVADVSAAVADVLHLTVREKALPPATADRSAAVLDAVGDPDVRLVVLPNAHGRIAHLVDDVIQRCPKPVVLVPVGRGRMPVEVISRILVPLDGTVESADPVMAAVGEFATSGVDVVALHVFDRAHVPRFWDQPVHARKSWDEEFRARYCQELSTRLELRSGTAGERVLDVAAAEHADLIALGWSQDLSHGRAQTVRAALEHATTPLLLVPLPAQAAA